MNDLGKLLAELREEVRRDNIDNINILVLKILKVKFDNLENPDLVLYYEQFSEDLKNVKSKLLFSIDTDRYNWYYRVKEKIENLSQQEHMKRANHLIRDILTSKYKNIFPIDNQKTGYSKQLVFNNSDDGGRWCEMFKEYFSKLTLCCEISGNKISNITLKLRNLNEHCYDDDVRYKRPKVFKFKEKISGPQEITKVNVENMLKDLFDMYKNKITEIKQEILSWEIED